jgi:hypothetical protein
MARPWALALTQRWVAAMDFETVPRWARARERTLAQQTGR